MVNHADESRAKAVELLNKYESNLSRPTPELINGWVELYAADVRREGNAGSQDHR